MSEAGHVEAPGQVCAGVVNVAEAHGKPSRARRIIHILGAVLVAVVLPMLLMWAIVGEFGATAIFMGIILGGVGARLGGTRRMLFLAPATGLAAGLGAYTAYDWWWAALLAATAAITGAGFAFGWLGPLLMLPFAATFAAAVSSVRDAVIYGVIVAIGTLYGAVIMRRFGAPAIVEGKRLPLPHAAATALLFGVALGGAAAIGIALDGPSRTGFRSRSSSWCSTSSSGSETEYGERRSVPRPELPPRYP